LFFFFGSVMCFLFSCSNVFLNQQFFLLIFDYMLYLRFVIFVYTVQWLTLKTRHNQVLLHHNALSYFYVHSFSLDRRVLFFAGMRLLTPGLFFAYLPALISLFLLSFYLLPHYFYLVSLRSYHALIMY